MSVVARNLFTNPGFVAGSGTVEVRRNLCPDPSFEAANTIWSFGGGATGTQSTEWASRGARSMKVTAGGVNPAAGDVRTGSLTAFPPGMSPGATITISADIYMPAAYVSPSSSGGARQRRIVVFVGGPGGSVTESFGPQAPNIAGVHRVSHTFTVPADATGVIYGVGCSGSASEPSFVTYVDAVLAESSPTAGTYFDGAGLSVPDPDRTPAWTGAPNASQSVLNGVPVAGWVSNPGQAVTYTTTNAPHQRTTAARNVLLTSGVVELTPQNISLGAGDVHTLLLWVRPMSRPLTFRPRVRGVSGPEQTIPVGVWSEVRFTAPAGNSGATGLLLEAGKGHQPGDVVDVDSGLLAPGSYVGPWFDGDTLPSDGYRHYWDGQQSVRFQVFAPLHDMRPVPRVGVDVVPSQFPVGSVTVSLVRAAEGRTFDVRGGVRHPASGALVFDDVEAPFGVESSYTVVGFDTDGNEVGRVPVGSVVLNSDKTVIQQPLDARLNAVVQRLEGTGAELVRSTPGAVQYPIGRVLPGMVGLGPRRGLQGVKFDVHCEADQADSLQATLGTYEQPQLPVWLVRTPPDQRIPRVFFCHVPELVELDTYRHSGNGWSRFQATVTEIAPPAVGITGATLTYSDVAVFYSTYSELAAQYATYSDIRRDASLIGAADA